MIICVIDTNVLVKRVIPEDDSYVDGNILEQHDRGVISLIAPDYILTECANVIWKHARRHGMSNPDLSASLRALQSLGVRLTPQSELLEDALRFAAAADIAVYDALFCVLAQREDAELITADLPLVNRLAGSGLRVRPLREWAPPG